MQSIFLTAFSGKLLLLLWSILWQDHTNWKREIDSKFLVPEDSHLSEIAVLVAVLASQPHDRKMTSYCTQQTSPSLHSEKEKLPVTP